MQIIYKYILLYFFSFYLLQAAWLNYFVPNKVKILFWRRCKFMAKLMQCPQWGPNGAAIGAKKDILLNFTDKFKCRFGSFAVYVSACGFACMHSSLGEHCTRKLLHQPTNIEDTLNNTSPIWFILSHRVHAVYKDCCIVVQSQVHSWTFLMIVL